MNLKIMLAASALALLATGGARAADAVDRGAAARRSSNIHLDGLLRRYPGRLRLDGFRRRRSAISTTSTAASSVATSATTINITNWVFGVEGDFNGVWNDKSFTVTGIPGVAPFTVDSGTDWLASIRARAGYYLGPRAYLRDRRRGLGPRERRCDPCRRPNLQL